MATLTIAQLVAVVSADTQQLDTRLDAVEKTLEQIVEATIKMNQQMVQSYAKASTAVQEYVDSTQRGAANLAEYEYKTGRQTVDQYKVFLAERMSSFQTYESDWRTAAGQMARIEIEEQDKVTSNLRAQVILRSNLTKAAMIVEGASKADIRNYDIANARNVIENSTDGQERAGASANLLQLVREQEAEKVRLTEEANKQIADSNANLHKLDYENDVISREEYKSFLSERMSAYEAYTSEWKAASQQLLALDREEKAELISAEKVYVNQVISENERMNKIMVASAKEADAMMISSRKDGAIAFNAEMDAAIAEETKQAEALKATQLEQSSVINLFGNMAAAITLVSAASAIFSGKIDHTFQGLANNTLMGVQGMKQMRDITLSLAKTTGQPIEDIAKGYMHISNFGYEGAKATNILTWANKEAVATMSDTESVANALASTIHIFGGQAKEAAGYMDLLHHAAASGNETIQQFINSSGPALAIAAGFKVSLADSAATMASLSKAGFNPSEAATQIKGIISHSGDPSDKVIKTLKDLQDITHVPLVADFTAKGIAVKGFIGILDDLYKATGGNAQLIAKVIPALRGGIGTMSLEATLKDTHQLRDELQKLQTANRGSETTTIYDRMMKDSAQKWKAFIQLLQQEFIPVGERAMKVFQTWIPTIKLTVDTVVRLMEAFQSLPQPMQTAITAIGGLAILNNFVPLLTALKVPAAFAPSLNAIGGMLPSLTNTTLALGNSFTLAASNIGGLGTQLVTLGAVGGPILLVAAAFGIMAWQLSKTVDMFHQMRDAENDALNGENSYQQKVLDDMKKNGEAANLRQRNTQIGNSIANYQDVINQSKENLLRVNRDKDGVPRDKEGVRLNTLAVAEYEQKIVELQKEQKSNQQKLTELANRHTVELKKQTEEHNKHVQAEKDKAAKAAAHAATPEQLAAYEVRRKELEHEAKAAATAAKELQKRYAHEIDSLNIVIAKKILSNKLDGNEGGHGDYYNTAYSRLTEGDLSGIGVNSKQGTTLLNKADVADKAAKAYADAIKSQKEVKIAADALAKSIEDVSFAQRIEGDEVKKAAVALAGGREAWERMTPTVQSHTLAVEKHILAFTALNELEKQWSGKLVDSSVNVGKVKTAVQEATVSIEEYNKKWGVTMRSQVAADKLMAEAARIDSNTVKSWVVKQDEEFSGKKREFDDNKFGTNYNVGKEAQDKWIDGNRTIVDLVNQMKAGTEKTAAEQSIAAEGAKRYGEAIREALRVQREEGMQKLRELSGNLQKESIDLQNNDPFQIWLNSFLEFKRVIDSEGNSTWKLALPDGLTVDNMKQVYSLQQNIQTQQKVADLYRQGTEGLVSGIMGGINSALSPDTSKRSSSQQHLLDMQNQLLQYQVAQSEYHSKYPNDPNDPYIQRIKNIQTEIAKTNTQIRGMGNNLTSVFTRMFDSIYSSFTHMLAKMAQEYLQSQLLKYLQRQIGTGSSTTGGKSNSWIGDVVKAIGLGLNVSGASKDFNQGASNVSGGYGVDAPVFNPVPLPVPTVMAAKGGDLIPGLPTWVGDGPTMVGGRHEAELIMPKSGGTVIPASKFGGSTTVINNNVTQVFNTPDVQSFRRSRKAEAQDVLKALGYRR